MMMMMGEEVPHFLYIQTPDRPPQRLLLVILLLLLLLLLIIIIIIVFFSFFIFFFFFLASSSSWRTSDCFRSLSKLGWYSRRALRSLLVAGLENCSSFRSLLNLGSMIAHYSKPFGPAFGKDGVGLGMVPPVLEAFQSWVGTVAVRFEAFL